VATSALRRTTVVPGTTGRVAVQSRETEADPYTVYVSETENQKRTPKKNSTFSVDVYETDHVSGPMSHYYLSVRHYILVGSTVLKDNDGDDQNENLNKSILTF
jgi:hypothetical protein